MTSLVHGAGRAAVWGFHQVTSRAQNLGIAGVSAYQATINSALAVINAVGSLATLQQGSQASARIAATQAGIGIADTYIFLLNTLNPNARTTLIDNDWDGATRSYRHPLANGRILYGQTPTALRELAVKQHNIMRILNRGSWLQRHVTARLAAPLISIGMMVAAVATTALGLLQAALSVVALGTSKSLNTRASDNLRSPAIIFNQFYNGILGIIRPDMV